MGFLDDIKGKAGDLIGGNTDKLKEGIEKAGDFIDEKTGGKFKDQVDGVQSGAAGLVDKFTNNGEEAPEQPNTDAPEEGLNQQ